jgi:hypothetical protein
LDIAHSHPPGQVPLRAFGFECVQALWGGCALWARDDRSVIIQIVEPVLWEKRYRGHISDAQWAEVERLIGAHHFLGFRSPDRNGLPDEARAVIFLVTRAGEAASAARWAGDAHPDFCPVYTYLRGLCRPEGVLVRQGPYERLWPEWWPRERSYDGAERAAP